MNSTWTSRQRSQRSPFLGVLFMLTLMTAVWSLPVAGQTVRGSLDVVTQTAALGWACLPGDASSKVSVDLWAWDLRLRRWSWITSARADKERIDVGNSGICGSGVESLYHGFENTILPDSLLKEGGLYSVRAYVRVGTTYQALAGGGTVSFSTSGLPTSSIWRTDYDDPNARSVAMVSCIWPFKGANERGNTVRDPLHLNAGATMLLNWAQPTLPGGISGPNWCIRNDPNDPASWSWSSSNSATNATGPWPLNNFWVVSANKEIAYSKTQSGPPSQSSPINAGGVYSVSMSGGTFDLGVDNRRWDYSNADFPFLSLGSEMGRGVRGPLAWLRPSSETYLEFDFLQVAQSKNDFHDIYVTVEFMWGGYKRFLAISAMNSGPSRFHWNWNALGSFWFPGGEFNYLGTRDIRNLCALPGAQLPIASEGSLGQWMAARIPLKGVLECLEASKIANQHDHGSTGTFLGWSRSRPRTRSIPITGVHIAIEQGPGQPTAFMQTRFTKPRFVQQ